MNSKQDSFKSFGLLILRVGISCTMLVHGIAKIQSFEKLSEGFPDPLGVGIQNSLMMVIGAEAGCSILLILGLITRLASIPLAFAMIIALFVVHANDPWNVRELAVLYLIAYSALIFTGAGNISLDYVFFGKRKMNSPDSE
jgi:putative oxidoreductase